MKTDNGPRVLVVDDEPSIVDAVATSLRYEGFTVDEAMTGRKALAQAQEDPPDLVILDVMLPDLDGLEVTRRLRSDGLRVPVLFLTARDTLQDKLAGLTVGGTVVTSYAAALGISVADHASGGAGRDPAIRQPTAPTLLPALELQGPGPRIHATGAGGTGV